MREDEYGVIFRIREKYNLFNDNDVLLKKEVFIMSKLLLVGTLSFIAGAYAYGIGLMWLLRDVLPDEDALRITSVLTGREFREEESNS